MRRQKAAGRRQRDARWLCATYRLFFLLTAYCLLPTLLWACPLCKDALLSTGDAAVARRAASGYTISIAALLGVPIVLIGGTTVALTRSARRANRSPQPR